MTHVLIFGDSNSHGTLPMAGPGASDRLSPEARWAGHLAAGLGPGWRVTVDGLPGRTTVHDDPVEGEWKNGLAVLPATLEAQAPADIVVIMLGTNDLKARFGVTAEDVALSLGRLLEVTARHMPGARRMLISPPAVQEVGPFAEMFADAARRSAALPAHIGAVASRHGAAFFDAAQVIATDPVDGIHFGAAAHETLGWALVAPIRALG